MSSPTIRTTHKITTPRLIIRTAIPEDAPGIASLRSNPLNNPYGKPDSDQPSEYLRRMDKWHAATAEGKSAFMVIRLRPESHKTEAEEESPIMGFGGFNEFRWGKSLDGTQDNVLEVDIGAEIDHEYWRKGYGAEALSAMINYAFSELGADHVSIDTLIKNEPWRRLMRSIGLGHTERHDKVENRGYSDDEVWMYKIGVADWNAAKGNWSL